MRPSNKPNLRAAGFLAALGLCGGVTPCVASAQVPPAEPPAATAPASDAPTAPAAAPSSKPKPANDGPPMVLLRTNGKVHQGEILRDANGYILKHRIGVIHFARRDVEGTFRSMEELYAYKVSLCPADDPDEQIKMATWCLEQNLKAEAKAHLQAVLELSPDNGRAKAMLANLDPPPRDIGVQRASVTLPMPNVPTPDSRVDQLRDDFANNPRAAGLPAIFDLPTPLAVRRYQEFSANVHPILQKRCANCHNESTPGEFQLIRAKTKKDLTNELIVRSNLESALPIINRDDLARSPILSAAGMTHNGGKPVLGGPASAEYRTLAAWVTSLKPAGVKAPTLNAAPDAAEPAIEPFAAGRDRPGSEPAMMPAPKTAKRPRVKVEGNLVIPPNGIPGVVGSIPEPDPNADILDGSKAHPAGRLIPGSEVGMPNNPPPDDQFRSQPIRKRPATAEAEAEAEPAEPAKIDPNAPKMIRLPSGELVPFMSKDAVAKKKTDPKKKPVLDPKLLDGYQKTRAATKSGSP